jgi:hypothetical protein
VSTSESAAQRKFESVVEALQSAPGVGLGKRGFGVGSLQVHGKIFAMISSKGEYVVKLPKARVEVLEVRGGGRRFDPGHGRLMKEWLVVESASRKQWLMLAIEAMNFVGSKS